MALGTLSDQNLAKTATLSGGAWSGALPLSNLKLERPLTRPARQTTPATLANSKFTATLPTPRSVGLVGLMFHTLSIGALYRLTVEGPTGSVVLQTPWTPAYGRIFPSSQLDWESGAWWLGTVVSEADLELYPRHLLIPVSPAILTGEIHVELDDRDNTDGYFDIGGLWIAAPFTPKMNFDRGRDLVVQTRSQTEEGPSGRRFADDRPGRRRLSVSWSNLEDEEAYRLLDAGSRARTSRQVLFVPDADDAISTLREAWPATFTEVPKLKLNRHGQNVVTATLEEVLA